MLNARYVTATLLATFVAALSAASPTRLVAHQVTLPEGTISFVGLKAWTPAQLIDSLAVRAEGVSLFDAEKCTKAMTEGLRFPAVSIEKRMSLRATGRWCRRW